MERLKWLFGLEGRLWSASLLNAVFLATQLWQIIQTHNVKGLSWWMFAGFAYMQLTYAQAGYRNKQWGMLWGMAVSLVITLTILVLIFIWR